MSKVRFSCPRCQTVMQTSEDKIGFDIACPKCSHRFTLVGESTDGAKPAGTAAESNPAVEDTAHWNSSPKETNSTAVQTPYAAPAPSAANIPSSQSIPPIYQGTSPGFSCPYCQSRQPPITKSEVSTVGWIVGVILLLTTCFFCWIGLLIRDKFSVCSSCKSRLPRLY